MLCDIIVMMMIILFSFNGIYYGHRMEAISMGLNHVFLPVSNLAAVSREVLRRHLKQVKLLPLQHVSQLKEYI